MNQSPGFAAIFPTVQGVQPAEPLSVSIPLNFTVADSSVSVDLGSDKRFANFDLQGIFLDASGVANGTHLTCNVSGPNQTISIPGGTQAFLPVLAQQRSLDGDSDAGTPGKLVLTFALSVAANVNLTVQLMNTPTPALVWTA